MKEIILAKYGELLLKGLNKSYFENSLVKEIKIRMKKHGEFRVYYAQSTIYIEPLDDFADIDGAFDEIQRVFGLVAVSRAAVCEKDMDDIINKAKEYLPKYLVGAKSFKVEAKRSDKRFALTSPQICQQVGGAVLSKLPKLKVDVKNPEVAVRVEVREYGAYIHAGSVKGAGGMPLGTSGRGLLLLSGGIDSPVAGFMMAKRGVAIDALHFESFPYTSERAKEKVMRLAKKLTAYTNRIRFHVISLTEIQEMLRDNCTEDYFTLLLRRYMMVLAEKVALRNNCECLITGESLAQVASQTMKAIAVTDSVVTLPVFRPCIGMDKEEIITVARKIDTFETSIEPYEDCCTVFTPRHPKTQPDPEKVIAEENKIDFASLAEKALETLTTIEIRPDSEF